MAKKKVFGENARKKSNGQRKMAKVIISKKSTRNSYAFKEAMVAQEDVRDYIKENKA